MAKFTHKDVQILNKSIAYQGFFSVATYQVRFKQFEGGWSEVATRECFERGNAAAVLLYDPKEDAVVLTEQFRIGALTDPDSPWLIELVAGMMESETSPEAVAKKETLEETGLEVTNLIPITHFYSSPGGSGELVYLYLGQVDATQAKGIHGQSHEHEDIKVVVMNTQAAFQAVADSRIKNGASVIALLWLQLNKTQLLTRWT